MPENSEQFGTFDYIVVGAGSAGCVLANRLSRDPSVSVLLVEAGGHDRNFWIHTPVGLGRILGNPKHNWGFVSEPEPHANNRITAVPRGKGLGGSSSINAMCYIRGHARDYDGWRDLGNPGWGWDDVLPYFRAIEDHPHAEAHEAHGAGGELTVSDTHSPWAIIHAYKRAVIEAGIPETEDFNRGDNAGVAFVQATIRKGRRWSASQAFLRPAMARPNLRVVLEAHVQAVMYEGCRVTGIAFRRNSRLESAQAREEVILAAGAIGSPQLLQVSGIGPGDVLGRHGVEVRHHMPGVGENMQDHWQLRVTYRVRNTVTMNQWITNPLRRYAMGAYYLATHRGPMSLQPPQLCAFTRSDPSREQANLQFHVSPYSSESVGGEVHTEPGFSALIAVLHPHSTGHCHITSADICQAPAILHNFLATPETERVAIETIRMSRRIVAQDALARFAPVELAPGGNATTDADLLAYARQTVMTAYLQSGTCKMGPDSDASAVVDARLRVRGIDGLRVVDASIMPRVVSGNTNAPTMMIAEKGAAMIIADRKSGHAARVA
ncbi:GMC family oxidoreductase N-terminal domain-containing protein [Bradyrhizobium sp. SRL28]|uniref:GMC family oxidoreductase n=1 Tax=Bradyrhizobium sp. SRL28 TaxID=2836178 RepID=UPI001BDF4B7C|nr:GMC family oxidoreductase N-terminal domain-containing protein [Bradyrhizobium sp. SRL28]MBT1510089.1 GMC family oxidoreductase N-terminal domain-containing protein [Bradyrhizobium sp. SRL28]